MTGILTTPNPGSTCAPRYFIQIGKRLSNRPILHTLYTYSNQAGNRYVATRFSNFYYTMSVKRDQYFPLMQCVLFKILFTLVRRLPLSHGRYGDANKDNGIEHTRHGVKSSQLKCVCFSVLCTHPLSGLTDIVFTRHLLSVLHSPHRAWWAPIGIPLNVSFASVSSLLRFYR